MKKTVHIEASTSTCTFHLIIYDLTDIFDTLHKYTWKAARRLIDCVWHMTDDFKWWSFSRAHMKNFTRKMFEENFARHSTCRQKFKNTHSLHIYTARQRTFYMVKNTRRNQTRTNNPAYHVTRWPEITINPSVECFQKLTTFSFIQAFSVSFNSPNKLYSDISAAFIWDVTQPELWPDCTLSIRSHATTFPQPLILFTETQMNTVIVIYMINLN